MFYKIFEEGRFQKQDGNSIHQASVSMIIEYPNNMIRLFSYAFWPERAKEISDDFFGWVEVVFTDKERRILKEKLNIHCYRVESENELRKAGEVFKDTGRLVCPHTANAIAWLEAYRESTWDTTPALVSETASPWKFLAATAAALEFEWRDDVMVCYRNYRALERSQAWCHELIEKIKDAYKKYWYEFDEGIIPQDLRDIYENGYESKDIISADSFHDETLKFVKSYSPELRKQVLELLR
jgi:threonine synthase